ncbi:MAG: ABC transporter ATP-binding protein [Dehalococcoidia bacterium]|nr:ABC transporter ATP-binding protein [Dehalococcoidia bacterium]
MPVISLEKAGFKYGEKAVLHDITLQTRPGEFLTVIGPNGSGKSTMLKGMCGLLRPSQGSVQLDGRALAGCGRARIARNIALMPQSAFLPELFTAMEIVLMGRTPHLGLLRYEGSSDILAAANAMEATETSSLAGRRINQLSGGERQRVLIARSLAQEAGILLLDEPTASLDINYQAGILDFLKKLCRDKGLTIVSALHDVNLASQFGDRIIVLKDGAAYKEGGPHEVINSRTLQDAFGIDVTVFTHPVNGLPTALVTSAAERGRL